MSILASDATQPAAIERFFRAGLKLQQLRILVRLAQVGQVRKVAEAFHVTQPAISKQIAEMEAALQMPLVQRAGRRLRFTAAGETLVAHGREILHHLEQARIELDSPKILNNESGHAVKRFKYLLPSNERGVRTTDRPSKVLMNGRIIGAIDEEQLLVFAPMKDKDVPRRVLQVAHVAPRYLLLVPCHENDDVLGWVVKRAGKHTGGLNRPVDSFRVPRSPSPKYDGAHFGCDVLKGYLWCSFSKPLQKFGPPNFILGRPLT